MTTKPKDPPAAPAPATYFKAKRQLRAEELVGDLAQAIRDVESYQGRDAAEQQRRFQRMTAARKAVVDFCMEPRP